MRSVYCAKLCETFAHCMSDCTFAFICSGREVRIPLGTCKTLLKRRAVSKGSAVHHERLSGLHCRINLRDMHRQYTTYQQT